MKRVHELDVYKLAEALSDMAWHDTVQKHACPPSLSLRRGGREGQISNF